MRQAARIKESSLFMVSTFYNILFKAFPVRRGIGRRADVVELENEPD